MINDDLTAIQAKNERQTQREPVKPKNKILFWKQPCQMMMMMHYRRNWFTLPCPRLSDHSRRAETVFPSHQELDSSFPEARTRNRHASALPRHRAETRQDRQIEKVCEASGIFTPDLINTVLLLLQNTCNMQTMNKTLFYSHFLSDKNYFSASGRFSELSVRPGFCFSLQQRKCPLFTLGCGVKYSCGETLISITAYISALVGNQYCALFP